MTPADRDHSTKPSEEGYDPSQDPDADPKSLSSRKPVQPNQAEGDDEPEEDGGQ